MLIQWIRWLKGYLKIQLTGHSPERFLNLCKNKKINVWGLISKQSHYELYILLKDFKKLKPICRKTISKIRILERFGMPFLIYRWKNRKVFLIGCIISIVFICISSLHIWSIQINGNQRLTDDLISTYLTEQEIKIGFPIQNLNCKVLATNLRENFEDIIWVSVSIDGTVLSIDIRENNDSILETNIESNYADIVAKEDAVITSMIVRNGIPMVKKGDTVKKGDILVSGSIPIMNDNKEVISINYVRADADILGETNLFYHDRIENTYQIKKYKNEGEYNEVFTDYTRLKYKIRKKYNFIKLDYTDAEKNAALKEHYMKYCESLTDNNVKILEEELSITHYKHESIAISNMRLEQPIDLLLENMLQ